MYKTYFDKHVFFVEKKLQEFIGSLSYWKYKELNIDEKKSNKAESN